MQLRTQRQQPDLEKHEDKGVIHHTALTAVVKLLCHFSWQPAANLLLVEFVNSGPTTLITEDVEAQYNEQFGAMVIETKQPLQQFSTHWIYGHGIITVGPRSMIVGFPDSWTHHVYGASLWHFGAQQQKGLSMHRHHNFLFPQPYCYVNIGVTVLVRNCASEASYSWCF